VIAETLAGRTDLVTLWPLSQGELTSGGDDFVDRAFRDTDALLAHRGLTPARSAYFDALCAGGFSAVQVLGVRARRRWFARYVQTVLQREIEVAADNVGGDFVAGIVFHTGTARLRFGDRMVALPAADVWT
jgi:uncharacterized protein